MDVINPTINCTAHASLHFTIEAMMGIMGIFAHETGSDEIFNMFIIKSNYWL